MSQKLFTKPLSSSLCPARRDCITIEIRKPMPMCSWMMSSLSRWPRAVSRLERLRKFFSPRGIASLFTFYFSACFGASVVLSLLQKAEIMPSFSPLPGRLLNTFCVNHWGISFSYHECLNPVYTVGVATEFHSGVGTESRSTPSPHHQVDVKVEQQRREVNLLYIGFSYWQPH